MTLKGRLKLPSVVVCACLSLSLSSFVFLFRFFSFSYFDLFMNLYMSNTSLQREHPTQFTIQREEKQKKTSRKIMNNYHNMRGAESVVYH